MTLAWAVLGSASDRAQCQELREAAREFWACRPAERPRRFGERVFVEAGDDQLVVRVSEEAAWPLAELLASECPVPVHLGGPATTVERALERVQRELGIDLSTSRARVGIGRGHLMHVVLSVPLDVGGEEIEWAAERFVELVLGDRFVDRWVVSIDVTRSARSGALTMLSDSRETAPTHELEMLPQLCRSGAEGIARNRLPALSAPSVSWTALEIPPARSAALQPDRIQASTTCPEGLKAALEGLPFDSARFSADRAVLTWFRWEARPGERARRRDALEATVEAARSDGIECVLAGTGFGARCDYLDVWVLPEASDLDGLARRLRRVLESSLRVGFYDTRWADESLVYE